MEAFIQVAIAFLGIAIVGRISKKLNSFYPPFYIVAGIILGPFGLGLVKNKEIIEVFADLGVIFLLFYFGFKFSFDKLINNKKYFGTAGIIDFIINFSIGLVIGKLMGLDLILTIAVAGLIYMSSSGIITKTLIQLEAIDDPEGELIMGIMIIEDLVMVFFLVFVSSLIGFQGEIELLSLGFNILIALVFCAILIIVGYKYSRFLEKLLDVDSKEMRLLTFLAIVLIVATIGMKLGVSEALGAFFLGMAFSRTKNKEEVKKLTLTFRDIFGSFFFFFFGMEFQLNNLGLNTSIVLISIILAIVGKLISSYIISKLLQCPAKKGLFMGLVIVSRGEFSLLIAGMLSMSGIDFNTFSIILILSTSFFSTISFKIIDYLCDKKGICIIPKEYIKFN
ncbi:cation:proton antiporter [Clostridium sp. D2Q-11]|uniref:Cation:proton antiporter n=1 Tax=Anaeromonas frigoriresistens TaxID=2683708 RepID=A0A942USY5_9FIRM|nr:cation:proton antiporter [Anaeromonas frigoriresistens]MBS4538649.1 cation:proton antiporter [Anaeromonas frigoriresistens]